MDKVPDAEEIAEWQANWNLPPAELDRVVRIATGSGAASHERILEGHGHEVHGVTTSSGQNVIVRIAWRAGPAFDRETWPTDAARRAGVPTPRQRHIEHTSHEGQAISINVQERLPGFSVYRLAPSLADDKLADLTTEAGHLLAALHGVDVTGRGPLNEHGQVDPKLGEVATVPGDLSDRSTRLAAQGLDPALLERTTDAIARMSPILDRAPTRLIHGDWTLANLLSDGTRITGVVDWEGSGGGDPASELRGWDFWHDSGPTSSDRLLAAYHQAGGLADDEFTLRRLLYRLTNLLDAASHFIETRRDDLLGRAMRDMQAALQTADALL